MVLGRYMKEFWIYHFSDAYNNNNNNNNNNNDFIYPWTKNRYNKKNVEK